MTMTEVPKDADGKSENYHKLMRIAEYIYLSEDNVSPEMLAKWLSVEDSQCLRAFMAEHCFKDTVVQDYDDLVEELRRANEENRATAARLQFENDDLRAQFRAEEEASRQVGSELSALFIDTDNKIAELTYENNKLKKLLEKE